jgi:hypothetical protein
MGGVYDITPLLWVAPGACIIKLIMALICFMIQAPGFQKNMEMGGSKNLQNYSINYSCKKSNSGYNSKKKQNIKFKRQKISHQIW